MEDRRGKEVRVETSGGGTVSVPELNWVSELKRGVGVEGIGEMLQVDAIGNR